MTGVRFEDVDFAYDGVVALEGVSFEAPAGKLTAVMGPSGCGKSTLIALAAGLLRPDRGRVARAGGRLGVAFQDPALLPWKTARDNVGFAMLADGIGREDRRARAGALLAAVGLAREAWDSYPRQLSGGMRQRVALARALAVRPELLLCDEPFSALDARARAGLWRLVDEIHERDRITVLVVTHDIGEALAQADVLVAMSMGRIAQVGVPAAVVANPANDEVAAVVAR